MIPKVIHYCWFGKQPLPKSVKANIDSWKKNCPDYTIVQWNEDNFDVDKYSFTREAYNNRQWAFVSDVARLDIIYNHGGIYLDTDVELLKSLDSVLDTQAYFACEDRFSVNTGLGFGAVKHNQFVLSNLQEYQNKHFVNLDGTLDKVICVDITSHLLFKMGFKANGKKQKIDGLIIYPKSYFCPIRFGSQRERIEDNTISIHHYDATWKETTKKENETISFIKKYVKYYIDSLLGYGTYNRIKKLKIVRLISKNSLLK